MVSYCCTVWQHSQDDLKLIQETESHVKD